MKLHVLARTVVTSPETPEPIVESLALHAETFVAVRREERIVRTEQLYRQLKGKIATLLDGGAPMFLCGCGNPLCNEPIELDGEDLQMCTRETASTRSCPDIRYPTSKRS